MHTIYLSHLHIWFSIKKMAYNKGKKGKNGKKTAQEVLIVSMNRSNERGTIKSLANIPGFLQKIMLSCYNKK